MDPLIMDTSLLESATGYIILHDHQDEQEYWNDGYDSIEVPPLPREKRTRCVYGRTIRQDVVDNGAGKRILEVPPSECPSVKERPPK